MRLNFLRSPVSLRFVFAGALGMTKMELASFLAGALYIFWAALRAQSNFGYNRE